MVYRYPLCHLLLRILLSLLNPIYCIKRFHIPHFAAITEESAAKFTLKSRLRRCTFPKDMTNDARKQFQAHHTSALKIYQTFGLDLGNRTRKDAWIKRVLSGANPKTIFFFWRFKGKSHQKFLWYYYMKLNPKRMSTAMQKCTGLDWNVQIVAILRNISFACLKIG